MRGKGFTLIELLAVIVILALIMLIAVPVVTKIISTSKEETSITSVQRYMKAVENSLYLKEIEEKVTVPTEEYEIMSDGNICLSELVEATCTDILVVEVSGSHPVGGKITIDNNEVTGIKDLQYDSFYANIDESGNIKITIGQKVSDEEQPDEEPAGTICQVTTVDTDSGYDTSLGYDTSSGYDTGSEDGIGDKYKCTVSDTDSYEFYVLSTNGDNVNLIMAYNLGTESALSDDGYSNVITYPTYPFTTYKEEVESDGYSRGELTYISSANPPTILSTLNTLTSHWNKIRNLNESYTDMRGNYTIDLTGYKARLPKFSEIRALCNNAYSNTEMSYYYHGCRSWLYGNYWTMDTYDEYGAWAMSTDYNTLDNFWGGAEFGIRPVITVSKSQMK